MKTVFHVILILVLISQTARAQDIKVYENAVQSVSDRIRYKLPVDSLGIYVITFLNSTGREIALGRVLKGDLDSRLKSYRKQPFHVVSRGAIDHILEELEIEENGLTDPATASQFGRLSNVRYLVTGDIFPWMGNLKWRVNVLNVETGELMKSMDVLIAANGDLLNLYNEEIERID